MCGVVGGPHGAARSRRGRQPRLCHPASRGGCFAAAGEGGCGGIVLDPYTRRQPNPNGPLCCVLRCFSVESSVILSGKVSSIVYGTSSKSEGVLKCEQTPDIAAGSQFRSYSKVKLDFLIQCMTAYGMDAGWSGCFCKKLQRQNAIAGCTELWCKGEHQVPPVLHTSVLCLAIKCVRHEGPHIAIMLLQYSVLPHIHV